MHDEDDFLHKLLENPADDTTRLVYADWLDEGDDGVSKDKAHFLRLTVRLREPKRLKSYHKKLQQLAAKLDTDWLAVVSRLKVEVCGGQRVTPRQLESLRRQFEVLCEQTWDEMTPTEDDAVRRCEKCKENVHYCDTIVTARHHARYGHCVAVDLGVIRREGDLLPHRVMVRGKISVERVQQLRATERERNRPDAVSEERERQKREQRESAEGRE